MKRDLLENLEKRLARLFEAPFQAFSPNIQADQLLARRLVDAMCDGLLVDASGRLAAPVYYEIGLNPVHASLWAESPGLNNILADALRQAAGEQGVSFEHQPVINAVFDSSIDPQDIQVICMEMDQQSGTTSEQTTILPHANIPSNAFLIINGDRHFDLTRPVVTIGRATSNQLVLDAPHVSRLHAQLRAIDWHYHLFDLDSTCGTLVNGNLISHYVLRPGDMIDIGGVALVYGQESSSPEETTCLPRVQKDKKVRT